MSPGEDFTFVSILDHLVACFLSPPADVCIAGTGTHSQISKFGGVKLVKYSGQGYGLSFRSC